jgi:hypothetical protein
MPLPPAENLADLNRRFDRLANLHIEARQHTSNVSLLA